MDNIILTVAGLMELSVRTAPKGRGNDFIVINILAGDNINDLGKSMVEWGKKKISHGLYEMVIILINRMH